MTSSNDSNFYSEVLELSDCVIRVKKKLQKWDGSTAIQAATGFQEKTSIVTV